MHRFSGRYIGAALQRLVRAFGRAEPLLRDRLQAHGILMIEADRWYDVNIVRSVVAEVGKQLGERGLHGAGIAMSQGLLEDPTVRDVPGVLTSLEAAYRSHFDGPSIGHITHTFEDDHNAVITFVTPLPCALCRGIVQGSCRKFVGNVLIEHGPDGCVDHGAEACTYHVAW
jgi:hypothetical protein